MENETTLYMSSIIFKKCPLILYLFSLNKSACLLTVKAFFKSTKQAKRYLLFLKKIINKGLECKYMITSSRPLLRTICSGHILLFSKYFSNLLNKILVNNLLRQLKLLYLYSKLGHLYYDL